MRQECSNLEQAVIEAEIRDEPWGLTEQHCHKPQRRPELMVDPWSAAHTLPEAPMSDQGPDLVVVEVQR
jgi:hypothetical protein